MIPLEIRERFHDLTVCGPCMLIGPNNEKIGDRKWTPRQAAESGKCYAATPKPGVYFLDFDWKPGQKSGADRADECADQLEQLGFKPAVWNSGGIKRAHLWFHGHGRTDAKEVVDRMKALYGADPCPRKIRPPFSPHRSGAVMSLRRGMTVDQAIEALKPTGDPLPAPQRQEPANAKTRPVSDIPTESVACPEITDPKLAAWLEVKKVLDGETRSEHVMRVAGLAYRLGYSQAETVAMFAANPHGAGAKFFENRDGTPLRSPGKRLEREVCRAWGKQAEGNVSKFLAAVRAAAMATKWPKRGGGMQAAFLQILELAERIQKPTVTLSVRQFAELAEIPDTTAQRYLEHYVKFGWLAKVKTAQVEKDGEGGFKLTGNVYAILPREEISLNGTGNLTGGCCVRSLGEAGLNATYNRGNWRALLIYIHQLKGEFTVRKLADLAKRSEDSVRKVLRGLESLGLVSRQGRLWRSQVTEDSLKEAAKARGTSDKLAQLKRIHRLQREGFRLHLEESFRRSLDYLTQFAAVVVMALRSARSYRPTGIVQDPPRLRLAHDGY